jgi:uncharacterized protein YkwD
MLYISLSATAVQNTGKPDIRIVELERRIHELVNKERKTRNLGALQFEDKLSSVARAHSSDMARRNFFSHVNPDGRNPTERGERAGYTCRKDFGNHFTQGLAENLYQGNLYSSIRTRGTQKTYAWNTMDDIAAQAVSGWMKSPGHRKNILQKTYDKAGIGIAVSRDDKVYVTQVFC